MPFQSTCLLCQRFKEASRTIKVPCDSHVDEVEAELLRLVKIVTANEATMNKMRIRIAELETQVQSLHQQNRN